MHKNLPRIFLVLTLLVTLFLNSNASPVFADTNTPGGWELVLPHVFQAYANPGSPSILYASQAWNDISSGIYRSMDGGITWTQLTQGLPPIDFFGSVPTGVLTGPAYDPEVAYVSIPPSVGSSFPVLYKTINGGETWTPSAERPFPFQGTAVDQLAFAPSNNSLIYAIDNAPLIYKSADSGTTWSDALSQPLCSQSTDLVVDPNNSNIVYTSTEFSCPGLYRSLDGGLTWSQLSQEEVSGIILVPTQVGTEILISTVQNGILRSRDNGVTWESMNSGLPTDKKLTYGIITSPVDSQTFYVLILTIPDFEPNEWILYETQDGGSSWHPASQPFPRPDFNTDGIYGPLVYDSVSNSIFIVGSYHIGGGLWKVRLNTAPPPVDCTPNDLNAAQWDMVKIHLVDALNQFPNCQVPPVKIAIIDTGVDILKSGTYHTELVGQVAFTDTAVGKNAKDRNGHGTHVAGIIGATQNNGIGIAGIVPHPQLYIYKYSDQWNDDILRTYERIRKFGTNDIEIIAKFIRTAVDLNQNIRVINISSGNMPYDLERPLGRLMVPSECKNADGTPKFDCNGILKAAIEYAQQHNVIIVVAAGHTQNGVPGFDGYRFPAAYAGMYPNVIAVASSRPTNEVGYYNITGNYITIAAPGGADVGCINGREDCVLSLWLQGGYKELEGTSMSAPHVTGVIGLMLAANPSLTPQQVKNILRCTATDFVIDPTRYAGAGIVNADGAVRAAFSNNTQCPEFP